MEYSLRTINSLIGAALIVVLVNAVMMYKFNSPIPEVIKTKSYVSAENVDRTLGCLALNIYREAGNESFEGKVAVAQVTINRVDNPKFPKDVCGVVYQKNVIMSRVVCQFSWYCEDKVKPVDNDAYRESYAVAKKVLLEGFRLDGLKDALYYHATYVNPAWPYEKVGTIGNHVFYKART